MTAVDKENDNIEVMVIDNPGEYEYQENYETDTEKEAIVKQAEALCRASMEYSDYIAYLRSNVGMDACAFFNNINKDTAKSIRIEVHHTPYTLFDIVKVVVNKYIKEGLPLNDLMIAEEAMKLHYSNRVGLIPLSKTLHLMVHGDNAEKIVIPAYMIFGNYRKFIEEYGDYMDEYDFEKVDKMIERTKELKSNSYDFLEKRYDYLNVDGFSIPKKIEDEEANNIELDVVA